LRQRRAGEAIFADACVELTLIHGKCGDGVTFSRRAAINPFLVSAITVDMAGLVFRRLAGPDIKLALVNGDGKAHDVVARPAAVEPGCFLIVVDAELEVA